MTRKQIKAEFPNEVDLFRTTLADVKLKLPGLDEFLSKNPVSSFVPFGWTMFLTIST